MMSRRTVLAGSAALLAVPAAAEAGALRFGIIADPQYADAEPNLTLNRYYANSLDKLGAAVEALNGQDLRFVATLGDVIDRDFASFDRVMPIYDRLRHPKHFLLGNHDFSVDGAYFGQAVQRLGMPSRHYDFAVRDVRFVVLDGNDLSLFGTRPDEPAHRSAAERLDALKASEAINAKPWNGGLSDSQFAWLGERLDAARQAGERVIVLNHYPLVPENMHNLWDAQRVVGLLTGAPHVVAYFNGHNHAGNYAERDGLHFVNFRGMVDTPTQNAFAVVALERDRMEITGYGREPSRSLKLRA